MTAPALVEVAPLVSKLIPRLASDHDGEVVATARAIGRVLSAAGRDWHDLANAIQPIATDWRSLARFCAGQQHHLSPRELDFIIGIARQNRELTEKQEKWLRDIAARLRATA
jgi:hypothetical protein